MNFNILYLQQHIPILRHNRGNLYIYELVYRSICLCFSRILTPFYVRCHAYRSRIQDDYLFMFISYSLDATLVNTNQQALGTNRT